MEKFWMVYVEDRHSPVFKHKTMDDAVWEAERILQRNKEGAVYVLEAVLVGELPKLPTSWTKL